MANRFFNQFGKSLEKEVVHLFAKVTFGSSGAPTLDAVNSKGIVSVTRNSAGIYTFVFGTNAGSLDTYNKLLMVKHCFDESGNAGTAPTSPSMFIVTNSISTVGTSSVKVEFNSAGTATDPASTEIVYIEFIFRNSNAP